MAFQFQDIVLLTIQSLQAFSVEDKKLKLFVRISSKSSTIANHCKRKILLLKQNGILRNC
jgi:hypothetical protein